MQCGQLFCSLACIEQFMLTSVIPVNFIGFIVFYLDYQVPAKMSILLYDSALNGQTFCCATFFYLFRVLSRIIMVCIAIPFPLT